MKKWESLFHEETSREHDDKVLETARRQLESGRTSSHTQPSWIENLWMIFSVRNLGFATAMGLGLLGFVFSQKRNLGSSNDLQLTSFNENYSELIENEDDIDFLSDEEFALIEDLQFLEDMSEDV